VTNSHRNHPSSYPATPAGSRALAAHLRNDHGIKEAVYRRLVEDHAAHSAMHAAAHENGAAMEVRIEQDAGNGRVLVTAASGVGEISYTMAGETAEFVHVTPADAFTWRGRRYRGTVMLVRADFTPARGYAWMLTDDGRGLTATRAAYSAISAAVSEAVAAHVTAHPEVVTEGIRADARFRAGQVADRIAAAEEELAALRAEHARLLETGGEQ
jgi:hypothetical protein